MNGWIGEINGHRNRLGGVALWGTAALAVFGAHAGGVAYMMRERPIAALDAPAPALMLELAPMAEAMDTSANNITDQTVNSAEVKSQEPDPMPEPEEPLEDEPPPDPLPEPLPEEVVEDLIDVPVEQAEVVIPKVRPRERPRPEVVEKVERKEKPPEEQRERKKRREPPPQAAASAASAQVQQSNRNAGSNAAQGSGSTANPQWRSRLMAHLERRKRMPSAALSRRTSGTPTVRFSIDGAGNVLSVDLARSSGHDVLDEAAVALVRRSSPVPAPPNGATTITVPIKFEVR